MLAAAALLMALGFWTYRAVEGSLREVRSATMRSLLDSGVNALRVWVGEQTSDALRIVRDTQVRDAAAALARLAEKPGVPRAELCAGAARARLEKVLRPLLRDAGDATFNLISPEGRLIATRFPEYCGLPVDREHFLPQLEPVFAGEPRFLRPVRDTERVASPKRLREGPAFAWLAVPVRDNAGQVIAALNIAEPVDAVFGSILKAARPGESGDAFAFDERGALLTAERFGEVAPLRARIAEVAGEGVLLDAYPNHRGVPVIGAWRWLPEYGMGIALEIGANEAYAPLRYLNIAFGVVFSALVIAVAAALAVAFSAFRLRQRIGEGRRLGPYALLRRIGEGGVATVHLARHDLLKRPAAVKLLRPARATDEMIARFEREVQLASSLRHPNMVEIFDYGRTRDGLFYYAMEYLEGFTIAEIVARSGYVPLSRTLYLLRQVCAGLSEAHGKGLVHRDIKPENIMVCRYGGELDFVKILDFGLVKHVSQQHSRDLTRSQRILGTPLYMAPERLRNPSDVDARADIYAVGAVAFLMLTGRRLFDTSDDLALTSKILNEQPPRPSQAAAQPIPVEVDLLVMHCLEKERDERPPHVASLIEALDALALEHRWTQRDAEAWWKTVTT